MKKKIILSIGLLLLSVISWMIYQSVTKLNKKESIKHIQNDLSSVLSQLGRQDVNSTLPTVLIFFNSECEHCKWEIEQLAKIREKFMDVQLLLVSYEPESQALDFLKEHNFESFYLKSTPEKIMTAFVGGVPQTFIYQQGRLVKHFKGEVKIEAILNALNEK